MKKKRKKTTHNSRSVSGHMQFKFPKTVIIGDTEFDMIYDKKDGGGQFAYPWKKRKAYIKIGTTDLKTNPARYLSIVIHELKEIIQHEQSTRFVRQDEHVENAYEFHYTHKEHTDLCSRLAGLLTLFIK